MGKRIKKQKIKDFIFSNKSSESYNLRRKWEKKGYDLINITPLCETKLGNSGWCNEFHEPDETIHHIKITYRDEIIANVGGSGIEIIDDDMYISFITDCNDFIIYRKVKR